MQNGGKKITNIKTYYCGYCVNHLNRIFKNTKKETRHFAAMVALFQHNDSYYLFDTGYSKLVLENGWRSKVYNTLNPIIFNDKDSLVTQLANDNILPSDIKGIILSHLHPDHIGGLLDFPNSKIYVSKKTYLTLKNPKLFDIIFKNLIPTNFENRIEILDFEDEHDFFGDGSLILKDVSGHTNGQMGMFLPEYNIFYGADSTWGMDLIDKPMKAVARFLQKDFKAYQNTIEKIKEMQENGIKVVVSHEVQE